MTSKTSLSSEELAIAIATAPAWRPTDGQFLNGKMIGVRVGETDEYGKYPVVIVDDNDFGIVAWHAFHFTAREALAEIKPKIGDQLKVHYVGKRVTNATANLPEKDQKDYHLWLVNPKVEQTEISEDFWTQT